MKNFDQVLEIYCINFDKVLGIQNKFEKGFQKRFLHPVVGTILIQGKDHPS